MSGEVSDHFSNAISIGAHPEVRHTHDRWVCQVCHASARDQSILEEIPCKRGVASAEELSALLTKIEIHDITGPVGDNSSQPPAPGSYEPYAPNIGTVWYERNPESHRVDPMEPWVYVDDTGWVRPSTGWVRRRPGNDRTIPISSNIYDPAAKELQISIRADVVKRRASVGSDLNETAKELLDHAVDRHCMGQQVFPIDGIRYDEESSYFRARVHVIPTPDPYLNPTT